MNLLKKVDRFVSKQNLFNEDMTVLLGLSGGADSVFLLHYLIHLKKQLNFQLIVMHFNHGWRVESDSDEKFCMELANKLKLKIHTAMMREHSNNLKWNGSKELVARDARRRFFNSVVKNYSNSVVALAHHQDDQIETFFLRLVRGAGLEGLKAMRSKSGIYVRPLLCIDKDDILGYLSENGIKFVIDKSNEDEKYLRNRIRMRLIPALKITDARWKESIKRTLDNLDEADQFLSSLSEESLHKISLKEDKTVWISLEEWKNLKPFLQKQLLLSWMRSSGVYFIPSKGLFEEISRFLNSSKSKEHRFYGRWKIVKDKKRAKIY